MRVDIERREVQGVLKYGPPNDLETSIPTTRVERGGGALAGGLQATSTASSSTASPSSCRGASAASSAAALPAKDALASTSSRERNGGRTGADLEHHADVDHCG
jgi:hypothetical protein